MNGVGNPHSVGQKPITFYREVLSLVDSIHLANHPNIGDLFPQVNMHSFEYNLTKFLREISLEIYLTKFLWI